MHQDVRDGVRDVRAPFIGVHERHQVPTGIDVGVAGWAEVALNLDDMRDDLDAAAKGRNQLQRRRRQRLNLRVRERHDAVIDAVMGPGLSHYDNTPVT
jgi:hypothetical protein